MTSCTEDTGKEYKPDGSSTTLAYLETFSSETEKALRQLRLKGNDILIGTTILLALSVAIVAIL